MACFPISADFMAIVNSCASKCILFSTIHRLHVAKVNRVYGFLYYGYTKIIIRNCSPMHQNRLGRVYPVETIHLFTNREAVTLEPYTNYSPTIHRSIHFSCDLHGSVRWDRQNLRKTIDSMPDYAQAVVPRTTLTRIMFTYHTHRRLVLLKVRMFTGASSRTTLGNQNRWK